MTNDYFEFVTMNVVPPVFPADLFDDLTSPVRTIQCSHYIIMHQKKKRRIAVKKSRSNNDSMHCTTLCAAQINEIERLKKRLNVKVFMAFKHR